MLNISGPILHHRGQLPALAVQVLLSGLRVFRTLLSLTPHDTGSAPATHFPLQFARWAPLPILGPGAFPGFSRADEQQEQEGDDEAHDEG